jgi:Mrp family chromosome partitioning ATPase
MKTFLVMSGKGGVGKTTISTNIAQYLATKGSKVGIMDADIHGPNVLELLGAKHEEMFNINGKLSPIDINSNLKAISISGMTDGSQAIIWRGPMKHQFIKKMIDDVDWGEIDFLIVDFPPGTGDEHLTAVQTLKDITGAIIISTPQSISLSDVKRGLDFCRKLNVPIIGAIENMSGDVFGENRVEPFCKKEDIQFLGKIPLKKEITNFCEKGKPFFEEKDLKKNFSDIMTKILGEKEK